MTTFGTMLNGVGLVCWLVQSDLDMLSFLLACGIVDRFTEATAAAITPAVMS